MGRIPEETIEQVLASTDIVDLIGSYLPLKRAGSNFKTNCPFHNEKTPSFMVNPARQSYHCFGCGEGGSAIGFIMAYENLPFPDAVKKLASRAGVIIQEEAYDPKADQRRKTHAKLLEIHNRWTKYMHQLLMEAPEAQHARDYLKSRGIGQGIATRWMLGWMPDRPQTFLDWAKSQGYKGRELCDSGLAALRNESNPRAGIYVRFRDRLMFPLHNDSRDVIGFSGRQLREDPNSGKYINSPETLLFKKSKFFYALDQARKNMTKNKYALLCEGQLDVIACHENGIDSTIGTLGTACTPDHARLLKRYTKEVILCFDADSAGFKAADKAFSILAAEGMHIRMVRMPDGEDPDSLIRSQGAEAFRSLVESAREYFDVKLEHETSIRDLSSVRERAALAHDLANLMAKVSDKITKEALINQVATRLGIGTEELRGGVVQAERETARSKLYENRQRQRNRNAEPAEEKVIPTEINVSVAYLCHLALTSREAQEWLCEQLESLIEPLDSLPGGSILRNILGKCPDTENPAAIQTFVASMNAQDQASLLKIINQETPKDAIHAAEETTTMLVSTYFQHKEASLRAKLAEPDLTPDHMIALMNEIKELQEILRNLQQRFIR